MVCRVAAAILTRRCLLGDQQDFRRKMKRTRSGGRPARRATRRPQRARPSSFARASTGAGARGRARASRTGAARRARAGAHQPQARVHVAGRPAAEQRAEAGHSARQQAAVVDRTDRSQHSVGSPDLERPSAGGAGSSGVERSDSMGGDEVRGAHGHSLPAGVGAEKRAGRSHTAAGDVPHSAGGADKRRSARTRRRGPHHACASAEEY